MAAHCIWLKEFVGKTNKVAIWAHNSHVAKNPNYDSNGNPCLGGYLKEKFGTQYVAIATSFSKGSFAAVTSDCFGDDTKPIIWEINSEPPQNSINYLFSKAKHSNYILLKSILSPESTLYSYLNHPKPFFGVGDYFRKNIENHYADSRVVNLIQCFDGVIHFENTTASNIIRKSKSNEK
jgi:erythromycin esterase-like protein